MLIRPQLIDRLAETLEGIAVPHPPAGDHASRSLAGATVLVYHSAGGATGAGASRHATAGESPVLEIELSATGAEATVLVNSALGTVQLRRVTEVRLQEATEEAAFYSHQADGTLTVLTISSRGVLQLYAHVPATIEEADFADLHDSDLTAAVALKIFAEHAEIFRSEA